MIEPMFGLKICENYSRNKHIARKWGQWLREPKKLLEQLEKCGFKIEAAD